MSFIAENKAPLIELLKLSAKDSSINTLKKWIKAKRVSVNGRIIEDPKALVDKGSNIALGAKKEFFRADIEILYEDKDIVVIYKPEGLLSVATAKESFYTAHDLLKTKPPRKRVYPVHRLDKDTSGVMLFAYSEEAQTHLKEQFEKHTIYREYRALVMGKLEEKKQVWESYLTESPSYRVYECLSHDEGAEFAKTEVEVIQQMPKYAFVKFVLYTGKKNQIRVQAAARGHAILGDKKYGEAPIYCPRLSLHAAELHFIHPTTGKLLRFSYPYPKELEKMVPRKSFPLK